MVLKFDRGLAIVQVDQHVCKVAAQLGLLLVCLLRGLVHVVEVVIVFVLIVVFVIILAVLVILLLFVILIIAVRVYVYQVVLLNDILLIYDVLHGDDDRSVLRSLLSALFARALRFNFCICDNGLPSIWSCCGSGCGLFFAFLLIPIN